MAIETTKIFNELMEFAVSFVEQQKRGWDQKSWEQFLSDAQQRDLNFRDEIQDAIWVVLESMQKIHNSAISTKGINSALMDITDITVKFISNTKGVWDHKQWEKYLKDVQKKGVKLTDETQLYIGEIMESAKNIYNFCNFSIS